MEEKLIGEVLFEGLSYKKMKKTLSNGKFESIEVAARPYSLISLPNGNLVCCMSTDTNHSYSDDSVILFNENLE